MINFLESDYYFAGIDPREQRIVHISGDSLIEARIRLGQNAPLFPHQRSGDQSGMRDWFEKVLRVRPEDVQLVEVKRRVESTRGLNLDSLRAEAEKGENPVYKMTYFFVNL